MTSATTSTPDAAAGGDGPGPIRLLLVDDQVLVRTGFRMVLDAQPDMVVVGEAGNGAEAIGLAASADVVLMDIRMPVMDGVEATRRIVASGCGARVLVLTTFDLDEYVHAAITAGASGFLLKDAGPEELLAGIRAVHSGDAVVAPSATRRLLERFRTGLGSSAGTPDGAAASAAGPGPETPTDPGSGSGSGPTSRPTPRPEDDARLAPLTDREREVLLCVGRGLSNQEIAAELYLAEATVKTHIGRILAKLDLRDRVHMVVLAYDTGLVHPRS